jgi:hypothetical protein
MAPAKQQVTIRVDSDILEWLKTHGRGYQTRINHILRAAMESQTTGQAAQRRFPARAPKKTRSGPKC